MRIVAVLDNVRSALNVGTMLRAADGGALEHVVLGGLTPSGDHPKVTKTSLGAERFVPWHQAFDTTTAVDELLDAEWVVWALEATPDSVPLSVATSEPLPRRLAIVVGNETAGVDPGLLERAHRHVHLPMAGAKTTLNVGVALGAAIYVIRAAEGSA